MKSLSPYGALRLGIHMVMIREIMALFDEYQSKENAKRSLRATLARST